MVEFFKKKSIAELKKESVEQLIKKNFKGYFKFQKEKPLPSFVVDEIIERIKLNLTADDLLFGVQEILEDNGIKIADLELFKNFVLACKVFYQVRKHLIFSSSSEAINDLEFSIRESLVYFHVRLHQYICNKKHPEGIKLTTSKPDDVLAMLKISGAIFEGEESVLKAYGMANCGALSKVAMKEFLQLQSDKKLDEIQIPTGDHAFLTLYNELVITNNIDHKDNKSIFLDIWDGVIAPKKQRASLLRIHKINTFDMLNSTAPFKSSPKFIKTMSTSSNYNKLDQRAVCEQAISSIEKIQAAAEYIVADIDKYLKSEGNNENLFSLLKKKQEDLMDFSADIQFEIDRIDKIDVDTSNNITLIDDLNNQIENFYTILFCKILRAPNGSSKFFDATQFLKDVKDLLFTYSIQARNHLKTLLSKPTQVENIKTQNTQDIVIDIDNSSENNKTKKDAGEQPIFQMNV